MTAEFDYTAEYDKKHPLTDKDFEVVEQALVRFGDVFFGGRAVLARIKDHVAELEKAARDLLDFVPPCDTDNVHVKVWCVTHQTKRCDGNEVRARALTALTPEEES